MLAQNAVNSTAAARLEGARRRPIAVFRRTGKARAARSFRGDHVKPW